MRTENRVLVANQDYAEAPTRICRSQDDPTTTPPKFRILCCGELGTEEDILVTTRVNVATQVSKSRLDSHECDPGKGNTQDDDRGGAPVEMLSELTIELEEHQAGKMSSEIRPGPDILNSTQKRHRTHHSRSWRRNTKAV
ncbi:hypothetical protein PHMEG_0003153 [Phytophthora megakarya]|uniref:Uncharacterized protein n=1 Tax=Phytophthora megakarya TaxID=4795 RepID=A0A225WWZ5_9STRA|nr:hypothetical protein PHMEG_0003153 [Phytophthora megakarya]